MCVYIHHECMLVGRYVDRYVFFYVCVTCVCLCATDNCCSYGFVLLQLTTQLLPLFWMYVIKADYTLAPMYIVFYPTIHV